MTLIRGPLISISSAFNFSRTSLLKRSGALVLGLLLVGFALTASPLASASAAPSSPAVNQCNGTDNVGGQAVVCDITIVNDYDLTAGTTSSTVTTKACRGSAGAPPTLTCEDLTVTYPTLTTSATQCNGSGNGAGANVICNVNIVNNITGPFTATAATVNQCFESGTGGGTQPTVDCDPLQNTNLATATIVQCNQSGNGGGGTDRVNCTVGASTETSALPVTVNQCVGSAGGGGATVDCSTRLTNNVIPAALISTPVPSATAAPIVKAAPELAETGFSSAPILISTASVLLLGGLVVLIVLRRQTRRLARQD
ncbi:MAG: hypothetical protein LH475_07295 [Cryobacterium sp.]|uniref:hypothetical protein n=1 Tax=unclassified Cryobacterium TaxID=2649013 RepID=UPI0018CA7E8D|nr:MULTISPECIES: hypothetical protein [unclassified Cryobacterium]MCY7404414.1 hypothetical protein [Cryobacterium sp.]MEC5155778.1 hypothetical protein [Cryobacterium sp. CAN_C3]